MSTFAVVPLTGGTVTNVIVGDSLETVTPIVGECVEVTEDTGPASIGYVWDSETGKFGVAQSPEAPPSE